MQKKDREIYFNTKIQVGGCFLSAAVTKTQENQALIISEQKEMHIAKFRRMLGHLSLDSTKKTTRRIGLKLTGKMNECETCMLAKMKQKNALRKSVIMYQRH